MNSNAAAESASKLKIRKHGIDLPFFVLVVLLMSAGLVMVFSASYANAQYEFGDSYHYIKAQFLWMLIGLVVMTITIFIPYNVVRRFSLLILVVSILLLVAVLFIGPVINDTRRWIVLGPVRFQPSEIAKIGVILGFSHLIAANYKSMKTFSVGILPFAVILMIISGLMVLEPHFSGTILILAIGAVLMIVGGANLKWFALVGGAGACALFYVIYFTDYAKSRIEIWLNPFSDPQGKGFQTIQSLYAIGSGGVMGLGLGNSRQKYMYIPEPQNDFIFAIVCEELGFIGALIIIILFVLLIWRGFAIAFKAPDRFSSLVVVGIISRIAIQTILNIAVVTNSIPNTGISLPFFSYGGSSLVILLFEMGLVLGISRYANMGSSYRP